MCNSHINALRQFVLILAVGVFGTLARADSSGVLVPMPGENEPVYTGVHTPEATSEKGEDNLLFRWYRKVSHKSIHRCPFKTSCSNFVRLSVKEHGTLVGMLLFMDRYFYRENSMAYYKYRHVLIDGRILLDDDFFITGGP